MFPLWYLTSWVVFILLRFWVIFVWKIILISWLCKSKFKFFICHNIFIHFKYFRFQMFKINFFLHLHIFYSFSHFVSSSKKVWLPFFYIELICSWSSCCFFFNFFFFIFWFMFSVSFYDFVLWLLAPFLGIGFDRHYKKVIPYTIQIRQSPLRAATLLRPLRTLLHTSFVLLSLLDS